MSRQELEAKKAKLERLIKEDKHPYPEMLEAQLAIVDELLEAAPKRKTKRARATV